MKGIYKSATVVDDVKEKKSHDEMWAWYEERAKRRRAAQKEK